MSYEINAGVEVGETLLQLSEDLRDHAGHYISFNLTIEGDAKQPRSIVHGLIMSESVRVPEICDDGIDNDGDGSVDCADMQCSDQPACFAKFMRGDVNGDGRVNISDIVRLIRIVLGILPPSFDCEDALDTNADGSVNISDAIPLLAWVFQEGDRLPEPFLSCGQGLQCVESVPACQ